MTNSKNTNGEYYWYLKKREKSKNKINNIKNIIINYNLNKHSTFNTNKILDYIYSVLAFILCVGLLCFGMVVVLQLVTLFPPLAILIFALAI